jgi:hypothetical protein
MDFPVNMNLTQEPDDLNDRKKIIEAACTVLKESSIDSPLKTQETIEGIQRIIDGKNSKNLKSYLIYSHILDESKLEGSKIGSRKGKGGGYFLKSIISTDNATSVDSVNTIVQTTEEKTLEKHLWPLIVDWFKTEKRASNVTDTLANLKAGGIWSNPDVIALTPIDDLGFFDIEIATAEVKPSLKNWRYFFFEAVSHKRFSERSYFIVRVDGEQKEEIRELSTYAEKYGIGLVIVDMEQSSFDHLSNWSKIPELERVEMLNSIEEYIPARFEPISLRDKIVFLRRIGITSRKDIYQFGRTDK